MQLIMWNITMDVEQNPENCISVVEMKSGSTYCQMKFTFFSLSLKKLHTNYQMSGKINSHICLMLSVYKTFRQTVNYGRQRNKKLQDLGLIELEIQIYMIASETKNRVVTGFQQPKSGLQENRY